ncbi:MAG: VOC family protein [Nannocystaceae bacterium]
MSGPGAPAGPRDRPGPGDAPAPGPGDALAPGPDPEGRRRVAGGLHHLALRVEDLERSAGFYGGVLGLVELARHREAEGERLRAIWFALGDAVLMLERALRGAGEGRGSAHLLALAVDDLGAWEARFAAAGVTIDDRSAASLYVRDPDGHRVGVSVHVFARRS